MGHHHDHNHAHMHTSGINAAFIIGIILNFIFVIVEIVAGFSIHSLSLISEAGHNLADVGALALSLLAFRMMKVKSTDQYTYGYRKTSILVALFNAVVLILSIGAIVYEAAHRFFNPEPLPGKTIAFIAAIGIVINGTSALFFKREKNQDLNIKGAYLHLLSDALLSLGLVLGGIVIYFTNWYWLDSVLSIVIACIILFNTWSLFKDSLRLSLDGVPADIHLDDIKSIAAKIPGIKDIHHVHVWALSTTENALTAHIKLDQSITSKNEQKIKHELKHALEHQNIRHVTLETEREDDPCESGEC
jgi:cobalt-zinc-cadmium efflux system protein